ncbi:MAG TPA: hypothetical protein VG603_15205 [Chitinophagales bacterium]|nr:hypothetical protein [Chitinophagales bacterium]
MITLIVIISLFCNGLYIITRPGMIFGFVSYRLELLALKYYWFTFAYKPLLGCIKCMASVWGIAISFLVLSPGWYMLWYVPVACICASATNTIIYQMYE